MNNRPLDVVIAIKRLQDKHEEISDYKLAYFVEHFWTSQWAIDYFNRGMTTQKIIKEVLRDWLVKWCKNHINLPKGIEALERQLRKHDKKFAIEIKRIKKARDPHRRKREFVHKFIKIVREFYQDMLDNNNWTKYHADQRLKLHFGFVKIPKWIWQSDKQIERKLDVIFEEIKFNLEVRVARRHPLHDCVEFDCPYCKPRKPYDRSNFKKKPILGTREWQDGQNLRNRMRFLNK